MKALEVKGLWWLPNRPDTKTAGVLKFAPGEAPRLELIGVLDSSKFLLDQYHPIILGVGDSGKLYTVHDCDGSRHNWLSNGLVIDAYIANFVLEGVHFTTEADMQFAKVWMEFDYLFDWIGISAIEANVQRNEKREVVLRAISLDPIEFSIPGGSGSFNFSASHNSDNVRTGFEERRAVVSKLHTPQQLKDLLSNCVSPIESFLDLATGRSNFLRRLTVFHPEHLSEPVEVYYAQHHFEKTEGNRLKINDMIFAFADVHSRINSIMFRWFELYPRLDVVFDLYSGSLMQTGTYLDMRFLSIVRALEAFHREMQNRKHATLKSMIEDLLANAEPIISPLVDDKKRFANRVVRTRDYYTHFNPKQKTFAANGSRLLLLTESLKILFQSCVLSELGVSISDQKSIFPRNRYYKHWIDVAAKLNQPPK